jgi:2-polyprenyl-3-methyl-5-hydroxy-6-metoxy-1,4-benzoquinol methylase
VARFVREAELLLALEGTALLRNVLDGDEDFIERRISALRRLTTGSGDATSNGWVVPELEVDDGYRAWAPRYDNPGNALIEAEEVLVHEALEGLAPGRALDAACGTGRHAAFLAERGHSVIGVDQSQAMLELARRRLPDTEFRLGDLLDLPLENESVDLVLSDAHPTWVLLFGQPAPPRCVSLGVPPGARGFG